MPRPSPHLLRPGLVARAAALLLAALARRRRPRRCPPGEPATKPTFKIYGFAQLDVIGDLKRVQPDWKDTLRPTKIPTQPELYGPNGETSLSVKQTRFGVWGRSPPASPPPAPSSSSTSSASA